MWILSLGYHIDAKNAYLDENLPATRKDIIYVSGDNVINKDASMYHSMKKEDQSSLKKQNIYSHLIDYPKDRKCAVDFAKEHSYLDYKLIVQSLNGDVLGENVSIIA